MELNDNILKILECGRRAPSADNSQPWLFQVKNNAISIYHNKNASESNHIYNIDYFADHIGLGATIKNMEIGAKWLGYGTNLSIFSTEEELVAQIKLEEGLCPPKHFLYDAIKKRHTNRKNYFKKPVSIEIEKNAMEIAERNGAKLYWINDRTKIMALADNISSHSTILWEDINLRENLLKKISFDDRQNHKEKIPISALELGWKKIIFKNAVKTAKNLEVLWRIIAVNSKIYTKNQIRESGAMCLLTLPKSHSPQTYINGGRIFEEIWLYLARENIALQPLFGPIDLILNSNLQKSELSKKHKEIQETLLDFFFSKFPNLHKETVAAIFRIGYTDKKASCVAPRKEIKELLK